MKRHLLLLLGVLISAGLYLFVEAGTLTVKGTVKDLITNKGIENVPITGTSVPSGIKTDKKGSFSFTPQNPTNLPFSSFSINTPSVSGARGVYASENNVSNFWETGYLDQVADIRCRAENAFCLKDEVLRDKNTSSKYNFVAEQAVTCTSATSTIRIIPAPSGVTDAEPGVATDGSRVVVAVRGFSGALVVTSSGDPADENSWNPWRILGKLPGNTSLSSASPAPRALGKNKFAIFSIGSDSKKFGILRDAENSKTPFAQVPNDFSFTSQRDIRFKTTVFRFSRITSGENINKVQVQVCS
ncbi:MAG: hypothetical protein HY001_01405 [Candidatus Portnoybacteria bacterium]|nr:hypothetical protein [Candidatus Portnoybacteria bacterium]